MGCQECQVVFGTNFLISAWYNVPQAQIQGSFAKDSITREARDM